MNNIYKISSSRILQYLAKLRHRYLIDNRYFMTTRIGNLNLATSKTKILLILKPKTRKMFEQMLGHPNQSFVICLIYLGIITAYSEIDNYKAIFEKLTNCLVLNHLNLLA
jgi:hypothetical protein